MKVAQQIISARYEIDARIWRESSRRVDSDSERDFQEMMLNVPNDRARIRKKLVAKSVLLKEEVIVIRVGNCIAGGRWISMGDAQVGGEMEMVYVFLIRT